MEKGLYRTIVTGSVLTPSRLEDPESWECKICNDGSRNSLGHRAWKCIATAEKRKELGLDETNEEDLPRCFTRSGVVPLLHSGRMSPTLIRAVHELLIRAAEYFEYRGGRFVNVEADKAGMSQPSEGQEAAQSDNLMSDAELEPGEQAELEPGDAG